MLESDSACEAPLSERKSPMANVLFKWELGGGLGHLINILPLVRGLRADGHRVFAALRNLSQAKAVFEGLDVALLQAPFKSTPPRDPIMVPRSFAHVLYNIYGV